MQKDVTVLSFGAGVQSTTLAMLIINKDKRLTSVFGDNLPTDFIFADPGSESNSTYKHIEKIKGLCESVGIGFHTVRPSEKYEQTLKDELLNAKFLSIPAYIKSPNKKTGMARRFCTKKYKVEPVQTKARRLMGVGFYKEAKKVATVWIGISLDEIQRMKTSTKKWEQKSFH